MFCLFDCITLRDIAEQEGSAMNQNQNVNWVQNQPYTVMLAAYRLAAERLQNRLEQLKQELRHLQQRQGQDF